MLNASQLILFAVPGSNPAPGGNLIKCKRGSTARSLQLSSDRRPDMTEILGNIVMRIETTTTFNSAGHSVRSCPFWNKFINKR